MPDAPPPVVEPSGEALSLDEPPPPPPTCARTLHAHVVALDQVFTYNRFGAFNPVGMIYALRRDVVASAGGRPGPGNARLRDDRRPRPLVLRMNAGDCLDVTFTNWLQPTSSGGDMPRTRAASFHVSGLSYRNAAADGAHVGRNDSSLAMPGETRIYRFYADHQGTFLAHSLGASAGGEGDGGSTVLGLFGAVHVEPAGARWYRSRVRADELAAATVGRNPDGTPRIDYEARDPATGLPLLAILDGEEIIHSDLDAIVTGYEKDDVGTQSSVSQGQFREFTVLFHDEIKAVQAFEELEVDEQLHGVRDGFAINYGSSGMGAIILAQRKKIGPAADCPECKYEEFFLTSWPNGDPALLVDPATGEAPFPDDPSNVHHAYVGDPVRIHNLHAGPAETHVFHLHAHQWLRNPKHDDSVYLDSQTIGPGGAHTYDVTYGGGGNRNFTPGDAIFHCHLYPHFAQGMWGLWRNHDVFEAGTPDRNLPDGEWEAGTPTPALVPMPGRPMPPMPTREPQTKLVDGVEVEVPAMPGYPHYIAGKAGRRPPQPPLDMVRDGGLPRHLFGEALETRPGDTILDPVEVLAADLEELPQEGTPAERAAMKFHAGLFPGAIRSTARYGWPAAAYAAFTPEGRRGHFFVNGQPPAPGAPYADPCPPGAPLRTYKASYLQLDLVVNHAGWHDPQARLIVLDEDVAATRDGTRPPEPLYFRANSGDCVVFEATNLIPSVLEEDDFQVRTPTDTVGQHIHLVKFDVTSSDGSANGWNYEDGTFSPDEVVDRIEIANAAGGFIGVDGTRRQLHPAPSPAGVEGAQATVQRWWADPLVNAAGADRTIRTVFTHDHFSPSSHQHHGLYGALIVEPKGAVWRDPETGVRMGDRADGGPTSWRADILAGNAREGIYREFNIAFADFALLYDAHGAPINPPTAKNAALPIAIEHEDVRAPEAISAADPGGMLINYTNEPIPLRIAERLGGRWRLRPGERGRMHNVFRSDLHGDPFTPLMRAYEGDRVQINLIQGAQEEQHVFSVHGQRWTSEIGDADWGFSNAQPIGISEHVEFLLDEGLSTVADPLGAVDYLYQSTPTDDLWNGMWGILRAYGGPQPDLLPLPNNRPSADEEQIHPCPQGAPTRRHTVHAITARGNLPGNRLVYNYRFGLYDPDAILFVRAEHLADLRAGRRRPEPLILRANAGDCIVVELKNELPEVLEARPHWNLLPPIAEHFNANQVPISTHVSLHPQLLQYDANHSDGATVGFNAPQHAPPGGSHVYTWYAGRFDLGATGHRRRSGVPIEFGAINLRSMADVVNHGPHGAIGALIVEPRGASWITDPGTEAAATVRYRDPRGAMQSFREFVLVYQDEVPLHSDRQEFQCADPGRNCGTALPSAGEVDDAEDSGHKAFNYRTEPFWARLGIAPELVDDTGLGLNGRDLSEVLVGDPETPIFHARVGQPIRVRVLAPSGHPRQHAFTLHGHPWTRFPALPRSAGQAIGDNPAAFLVGSQDGFSAMMALNVVPRHRAGGPFLVPMDYLYRDQTSFQFSNGLWGLLRVLP